MLIRGNPALILLREHRPVLKRDDEARPVGRDLRLDKVMCSHKVKDSSEAFSHLAHIAEFSKGARDCGVSRLMGSLQATNSFDSHIREQCTWALDLKPMIENVDLDCAAFGRVVAMSYRVR